MEPALLALIAGAVGGGVVTFLLWLDQRRPDARTPIAFVAFLFAGLPAFAVIIALLVTDRRPEWWVPASAVAVAVSAVWVASITYQYLGPAI